MPSWMEGERDKPRAIRPETEVRPVTAKEVAEVIADLNLKSSPGPDGLAYSFWKDLDEQGVILSRLFEICRMSGAIPESWRGSRVKLISKGAGKDVSKLENWRPISLLNTLYKTYASVIARRLQSFAVGNEILSPTQKGFLPVEGVYEHAFVLDQVIADATIGRRNLCVAWLDIKDAFGSVDHTQLIEVMKFYKFPPDLIWVVQNIYESGWCTVRTANTETGRIDILRGVRQGCPLSTFLFNLIINVLLVGLNETGSWLQLDEL